MTTEDPEFIEHPLLKDKAVEGRIYQGLILSNIVKFNSLVVAPTGTGKTILFLLTAVHALQNSSGFAIILAPTLSLIDQHVAFFHEKTTFASDEILAVTGKINSKKRKLLWQGNARIFVSTPETLVNDLNDGFVDLNRCRLLVIDEAHRGAQNKYQKIMQFVKKARMTENTIRILAVSATIPEAKLLEIMSSLDIEHVEIKTARDHDVAPFVTEEKIDQIIVPLPEMWYQVMDVLLALRAAALRGVNRYKALTGVELHETASRSTLLSALNHLQQVPAQEGDLEVRANLSSRLAAAIKLDHALDLFSRQGKTAFLEFVQNLYKKGTKANQRLVRSPQLQKAIEIATVLDQEHPKVRELLRILKQEPAKTVMVFSRSKPTVFQLEKILQEKGVRTGVLVGKRDLTEEKRKKVLQEFQSGQIRVLVSTNVGEEGLDVGCDLVIFYDATASVIRRVQRKGRLRKHGKIVFLIAKDTTDEVFHWISTDEEIKMHKSFERLKDHTAGVPPRHLTPNGKNEHDRQQKPSEDSKRSSLIKQKGISKKTPLPRQNGTQHISIGEAASKTDVSVKVDPREASIATYRFGGRPPMIAALGGPSLVIGNVAVFRVRIPELLRDIAGGTLLPKLINAAKHYTHCVIILEESLSLEAFCEVKIHAKTVLKTIWSIVLDLGISMVSSDSSKETKHLLELLVEHQQTTKEPTDLTKNQENLVASLPGVSKLLAKRLLATHRTPRKIFLMNEEELQATRGLGKEKSRKIFALLNNQYPN